jgi:glycosyltransferase involved in cell wall biosynthesis
MRFLRYGMISPGTDTDASLVHPDAISPFSPSSIIKERGPEKFGRPVAFNRAARVQCEGKFLSVDGRRFWIKGVTYGTFGLNEEGEPYPPIDRLRRDFEQMRAAGINTVRLYTPPSDRMADAAAEAGLFLIADVCWGPRSCQLDSVDDVRFMRQWVRGHARRLGAHPAILCYSLGNEIPPLIVRWYGRTRIQEWLRELYEIAKEEAPETLVTYVNHPPTEHLDLSFLDIISWNIYLEREPEFRAYLGRLQALAGERPVLLAELGLDSRHSGEKEQANFLSWQIEAAFEKGCCGVAVYSWTDEWQIFDSQIDGWAFGLTDAVRRPKAALHAVRQAFRATHAENELRVFPKVSVVVCAYNAGATIDECLDSLTRLNYPDYEVIVVDDGSTDDTAERAESYDARVLRAPRGGLSRARNAGIEAAEGSIVAFIDSDAYADPDWLFFLVTGMEQHQASAVGGPNLSPSGDGFVARCVNYSPGNPTHVLLDNERAEHVPGCNMAFQKAALKRIGGFDPTHRAAGDDVDICWKILARNETIAFSPAALVWHHRRPTVRTYLKQQTGYGYAEAHLRHRYPGHYNLFGHAVWRGGVYDGTRNSLNNVEFSGLLESRIYQGRFCSAQFQSVYPALPRGWFRLLTTIEWMLLTVCLAGAGIPAAAESEFIGAFFFGLGALCGLGTLTSAWLAGIYAANAERWTGTHRLLGTLLVATLHLAQPVARAWGWFRGKLSLRCQPLPYRADDKLYGHLAQREQWLTRLESLLRHSGWIVRPSDSFTQTDLDILGPGPFAFHVQSLCEEHLDKAKFYLRYRVSIRCRLKTLACLALTLASFAAVFATHLWPLLLPLGMFIYLQVRALWRLPLAISQIAVEAGEALGMPLVRKLEP